jgi:hypothetical protein
MFIEKISDIVLDPPVSSVRSQRAFYPSDASIEFKDTKTGLDKVVGGCLRAQYFRLKGTEPTESPSVEGVYKMTMGGAIQSILTTWLQKAGLWMDSEISIWIPKFKISGRVDLMLWHPTEVNTPVGMEVKTISGFMEKGLVVPNKGAMMPRESDLCQVVPYLDFYSQYIPGFRMILMYISRESGRMAEHVIRLAGDGGYGDDLKLDRRYVTVQNDIGSFEIQHVTVAGIYSRWLRLAQFIREGNAPPPDYELQYSNDKLMALYNADELTKTKKGKIDVARRKDEDGIGPWLLEGDWQCQFCGWKTLCWHGVGHMKSPALKAKDSPKSMVEDAPILRDSVAEEII